MAVCPSGHVSQTSDYCDTCGAVIGGAPVSAPSGSSGGGPPAAAAGSREPCPSCGAAQEGRFCEECGYDFELAALVPAAEHTAPLPSAPAPAPRFETSSSVSTSARSATPPPPVTTGLTPEQVAALLQGGAKPAPAAAPAAPAVPVATVPDPIGNGAPGPGGFDLDAALAQAESEAQAGAAASVPAAGPEPSAEEVSEAEAESTVIVLGTGSAIDLIAVVNADQSYYRAQVDRGDIIESEFAFPKYPGERRIALDVGQVRIGRASASRGLAVEIDLTGPPLDPAISHLHAQLLRQPDHTWTLVDMNSANGTRLNDAEEPIPAETEVPVGPGDRIHLGVWTTITLIEA